MTEAFTSHAGRYVPLAETVAGCAAILDGRYDQQDEASLYMIGAIAEAAA
jgi:F-type H+-transporting ATPase subunit beta